MRHVWPLSLGAMLVLGACSVPSLDELLGERTVKVGVSFNFKAGCIVVVARDKAAPDKSTVARFEVLDRSASERRVDTEVLRGGDWSPTLEIVATAHEVSCPGPEVARSTSTVTLNASGVQTLSVALTAVDADGDGYVPTAGGGTDCADNDPSVAQRSFYLDEDRDGYGAGEVVTGCTAPARHVALGGDCDDGSPARAPGLQETCDGVDNDCVDGLDNGLPQSIYYLDGDRDGVGAGQAVSACDAPANHVLSGNDCDDSDTASRPGATETCDDKDNDCDSRVDEGLTVSTYFRDEDGDGFGLLATSLQKCRQPEGYVTNNTDCNDGSSAVTPNAQEVCNEVDDNCRNGTDEGYNKTWHRDQDGDTFGLRTTTMIGCERPTGYVAPTTVFDCNDGDGQVNPNAIEKCNGVDDNCVNGDDEPFTTGPTRKGATCGSPCTGIYVCNDAQDGTRCNAPTPENYYTDADGDGDGANNATAQVVCAPTPPPVNTANRNTDCDDTDRHNRGNGAEVCDFRDNDCDTTVDEGNVCMGTGWRQLADSSVTGRDWNTVAISKANSSGYPVWIAGANGALARRASAGASFTSFDGACGNATWNAAWVSSDGSVFLAGSGGRVARHDGTTCSQQYTLTGTHNVTGITGFDEGGTLLYVVDEGGQFYSWTPGSAPVLVDDNSDIYRDVHGFDRTRLVIGAQESTGNQRPLIQTYTGGMDTSSMTLPSLSDRLSIRSIWMVSPTLAYAVADGSVVLRWQGAGWSAVTPPASVGFTSVCAPDRSSVYVTDAEGVIRRYTGTQWVPQFTSTPAGALRDIALVSPTNIWAVGPGGRVIHFPELP